MAVERQAATGSILDFREEHLLKSLERLAIYSHTTHQNDTIYSDEFDEHPAVGEAFTRNFYGADEKRRLSQRTMNTAGKPRHVQTEYRYDALGRRVLLRSRTDSIKCGTSPVGPDCLPTIERFYWDGDQLLVEHRGDGGYSETLTTLNALPTTSTWYGRVRYTHAMGIDDPLAVRKTGSTPFVPHRSGRGGFEAGTYWTGASMDAYHWPQRNAGVYLAPDARAESLEPLGWFGSLLDGKTDPNGLQYMRNRYYDPASGRFTQPDPIGLAGGMNLYGYAAGDPINNSDPMGLSPQSERDRAEAQDQARNDQWVQCKGDRLCDDLWNHYNQGTGATYFLSDAQMAHVANVANSVPNQWTTIGSSSWNDHLATEVQVRFYGTDLQWALGTATLYFAGGEGAIGFRDNFDFDKKCWFCESGRRNWRAEAATRLNRLFVSSKARPFLIRY